MPEKPKGLHAKLAEVMAEADRIPKNGQYQGQGAFKYVMVGDAADAIRSALGVRGVSMLPSTVEVVGESEHATKSGGTMTTLTVRTTWTLTDGETGETAVIQSMGTGADSGDKASPKAQTNAMKYALLMGFLLSTGDDPEQTNPGADKLADESLELLGRIQKDGVIKKGGAERYQADWRETPDGHTIGFALKLAGEDRDIPQVLIEGSIGQALYVATASTTIVGTKVTVKGHLYNVRQKGRTSYYRLIISKPEYDFIETPEVRVPMLEPDPLVVAAQEVAAGQVAAFDEPISEEEAAAILEREKEEAAL